MEEQAPYGKHPRNLCRQARQAAEAYGFVVCSYREDSYCAGFVADWTAPDGFVYSFWYTWLATGRTGFCAAWQHTPEGHSACFLVQHLYVWRVRDVRLVLRAVQHAHRYKENRADELIAAIQPHTAVPGILPDELVDYAPAGEASPDCGPLPAPDASVVAVPECPSVAAATPVAAQSALVPPTGGELIPPSGGE